MILSMPYLKSSEQGHVVTEGVGCETLAAVQGGSPLSAVGGKDERVTVGQRAGDGENGVQTLEHDGTQHHLAQVGLHR